MIFIAGLTVFCGWLLLRWLLIDIINSLDNYDE